MKNLTKLLGIIAIGAVIPASVSALDWKAYPDPIEKGDLMVSAGIGFGTPLYGDMTIPPIVLNVDYALPLGGIPFTLGGFFGFTQSKYDESWGGSGYTFTFTGTAFGARLGYHPNLGVKNLDVNAALGLGYYLYTGKSEYTGSGVKTDYSRFYFGLNIGARYFFTPIIGAWAELGYSALAYVSAGVTFKLL
jgi:hypothetical protein